MQIKITNCINNCYMEGNFMLGSQNSVRFSRMGTSFIIEVFTSAPRGLEVAAWVKDLSHFTFQKKKDLVVLIYLLSVAPYTAILPRLSLCNFKLKFKLQKIVKTFKNTTVDGQHVESERQPGRQCEDDGCQKMNFPFPFYFILFHFILFCFVLFYFLSFFFRIAHKAKQKRCVFPVTDRP